MICSCFRLIVFVLSAIIAKLIQIVFIKFPLVKSIYYKNYLIDSEYESFKESVLERLEKLEAKCEAQEKEIANLKQVPTDERDGSTSESEHDSLMKPVSFNAYPPWRQSPDIIVPTPKPRLSIKDTKIPPPPPPPPPPMFNVPSMINRTRTPYWTPKVTPDSTPFQTPRTLSTESLNTLHLQKNLVPASQKPSRGELLSKRKQLKTARSPGGTPLSQRLQGTTKDFQQSRVTNRIPTAIEEELSKILKTRRQPSPDKTMDSSFEQDFSFS